MLHRYEQFNFHKCLSVLKTYTNRYFPRFWQTSNLVSRENSSKRAGKQLTIILLFQRFWISIWKNFKNFIKKHQVFEWLLTWMILGRVCRCLETELLNFFHVRLISRSGWKQSKVQWEEWKETENSCLQFSFWPLNVSNWTTQLKQIS